MIRQTGWRLVDGLAPLPPAVFEAWSELWHGALSVHDRRLRLEIVGLPRGQDMLEWRIGRLLTRQDTMPGEPKGSRRALVASAEARCPGAPFRPGSIPFPPSSEVAGGRSNRWGRPRASASPARRAAAGGGAGAARSAPPQALGYVLCSGPHSPQHHLRRARGAHLRGVRPPRTGILHVPGSWRGGADRRWGADVWHASGRLRVGELRVLCTPACRGPLSPRAGEDPAMHALTFKIQGYETPDGSCAQFVRGQAPQCGSPTRSGSPSPRAPPTCWIARPCTRRSTTWRASAGRARVCGRRCGRHSHPCGGGGAFACARDGSSPPRTAGRLVLAEGRPRHVNRKAPGMEEGVRTGAAAGRRARGGRRRGGESLRARGRPRTWSSPRWAAISSPGWSISSTRRPARLTTAPPAGAYADLPRQGRRAAPAGCSRR